jgi:signal transduction histidine kinase
VDPEPAELAPLAAAQQRHAAVMRWLRPLIPAVLAVVVWGACVARPRPGLAGRHLAVSVALAGLVVAGIGALATLRGRRFGGDRGPGDRGQDSGGPRRAHLVCIGLLLASSGALVWLQPDGVGIAGVFVGLSLLLPVLHRGVATALTVGVLAGVAVIAARHGSVTSALLNSIMLGAFYGMMILALRLTASNELAQRLLAELTRSRAEAAVAARLAERQRLAREMHDVLAHSLSGLMLQLEGARLLAADNPADPRLPDVLGRAHHLGREGLAQARRAIGTLRDDELPGPDRLAALGAEFERDHQIPCHVSISGAPRTLASEAALAVYRVAQEALTNAAKHASPQHVEISLVYQPDCVHLTIQDAGDPAPPGATTGGYGLTGMRERAALVGGTLTAESTVDGFRVELAVPG